jgi:chemotaxis-related protein WspD
VFRLGDEWLALPVSVLVEVTTPRPAHRVPHRGGVLAGVVNIRGELHLCVHLDQVLGVRRPPDLAPARLLVVQREADLWVFPVDGVDQVHRVPLGELTRVPPTVGRALGHLTRGVFQRGNDAVGLLDDDRLMEALRAKLR